MTSNQELISVIVPVYDVNKYLEECVESILAQTYENIECILVDDGSPDSCGEICDNYADQDARVKVIHKRNGGRSSARNAGLNAATGDFIGFVDGDDLIAPTMYQTLMEAQAKHDADLVRCGFLRFDSNATPTVETSEEHEARLFLGASECLEALVNMQLNIVVWNKLYKSELIGDIRFPEEYCYEDQFFLPEVCRRSKITILLEEKLYFYRIHPQSFMQSAQGPYNNDLIKAKRFQRQIMEQSDLSETCMKNFYRSYSEVIEDQYKSIGEQKNLCNIRDLKKELQEDFRNLPWRADTVKEWIGEMLGYLSLDLLLAIRRYRA